MVFFRKYSDAVTKQTGAHSRGALVYDPTISVERNRFLLTGFQPCGGCEHFSSESCSPTRPGTSLAPQKAISQKPPNILVCAQASCAHSLAAALPFRIWGVVISLHVIVQEYMRCVTLDHGEVQERHKSQECGLSVYSRSQGSGSVRQQASILQGRVLDGFGVS